MFCPYRVPVKIRLPVSNRGPDTQHTGLLRSSLHTLTGTEAVAAKTLCHFVVEFVDGIQIVYLKSLCKLHFFCTLLSTVRSDTEMEANHTPSQELLLSLFPL